MRSGRHEPAMRGRVGVQGTVWAIRGRGSNRGLSPRPAVATCPTERRGDRGGDAFERVARWYAARARRVGAPREPRAEGRPAASRFHRAAGERPLARTTASPPLGRAHHPSGRRRGRRPTLFRRATAVRHRASARGGARPTTVSALPGCRTHRATCTGAGRRAEDVIAPWSDGARASGGRIATPRGRVLEDEARGGGRQAGRVAHSRGRSTGGAAHRRAELLLQGGNRADCPPGGLLPRRGRRALTPASGRSTPRCPLARPSREPPFRPSPLAPRPTPSPATRGAGTSTAAWSPGPCRR
jgi:hypothetical protein